MGNILQGRPLRQFTSLKRIKSKSVFKINCHESHFSKMTSNSLKMSKTFNVLNLNREYVSSKIFKFSMSWINNNSCCFVATHKMGAMK